MGAIFDIFLGGECSGLPHNAFGANECDYGILCYFAKWYEMAKVMALEVGNVSLSG